MPSAPRYFLREEGHRTGPHSLVVLKQKAELGLLSADTLIAPETEPDSWAALRESQVLHEELLPPRPHYALGKSQFTRVNHTGNLVTPSVDEMLRANVARQREAEGELLPPLPPRPNRRRSDYLCVVAAGAALSMIPWLFIPLTVGLILLSFSATVFLAACFGWVMFGIMDRY